MVTGISPSMLKARVMGSKTSSTGASTTEELLEEDSGTELSEELLEELTGLEEDVLELTGLEEEALELEELELLLEEELLELEELELLELELSEEELEEPVMSLIPSLLHFAVKVTSMLGAETPWPAS